MTVKDDIQQAEACAENEEKNGPCTKKHNPNAGHRQRMYDKFDAAGLKVFADHEVLEMLLYYIIPRSNTNLIGHELLKRFGSLHGVLEANIEQLKKVHGIDLKSARLIHLVYQIMIRYQQDLVKTEKRKKLDSYEAIAEYCLRRLDYRATEALLVFYVNSKLEIIGEREHEGKTDYVWVDEKELIQQAVLHNASGVILSHNHPNGVCEASREDLMMTQRIATQLQVVGMKLYDHCIVARGKTMSVLAHLRRQGIGRI